MARPRNNISKLPFKVRYRIFELLNDGFTYDVIRSDARIVMGCAAKDIALHNRSFLAYTNGVEYKEFYKNANKQIFQKNLQCPNCDAKIEIKLTLRRKE